MILLFLIFLCVSFLSWFKNSFRRERLIAFGTLVCLLLMSAFKVVKFTQKKQRRRELLARERHLQIGK